MYSDFEYTIFRFLFLNLHYRTMSLILGVHPRVQPADSPFIIKEVCIFAYFNFVPSFWIHFSTNVSYFIPIKVRAYVIGDKSE